VAARGRKAGAQSGWKFGAGSVLPAAVSWPHGTGDLLLDVEAPFSKEHRGPASCQAVGIPAGLARDPCLPLEGSQDSVDNSHASR